MADFGLGAAGEAIEARIVSGESELREQLLQEAEARDAVRATLNARIDLVEAKGGMLATQLNRLDGEQQALEALAHAHEDTPAPPQPPPPEEPAPPSAVEYGQREGPRTLPPLTDIEAANYTLVRDFEGAAAALGETYVKSGQLYRNGIVVSTYRFPSLFRCYDVDDFALADLDVSVPEAQWYNRDAVVDLRHSARRMLLHNFTLDDAPEHGVELDDEAVIRGCDIGAKWVALAGGASRGHGGHVSDSRFRMTQPVPPPVWNASKDNGPGKPKGGWDWKDRAHYGAAKVAPVYETIFERVDFEGVLWEDVGSGDNHYTDIKAQAIVAEINDNQGQGAPMYLHHFTATGGAWRGFPVEMRQQGNLMMHLGPIVAEHGLIDVDLTHENGIVLWDNDGRAQAKPSLSSAGSRLSDTLVRVRASDPSSVRGRTVHFDHVYRIELERVVFRLDASVPQEERARLEALVAGRGNGCKVEAA